MHQRVGRKREGERFDGKRGEGCAAQCSDMCLNKDVENENASINATARSAITIMEGVHRKTMIFSRLIL